MQIGKQIELSDMVGADRQHLDSGSCNVPLPPFDRLTYRRVLPRFLENQLPKGDDARFCLLALDDLSNLRGEPLGCVGHPKQDMSIEQIHYSPPSRKASASSSV